MEETCDKLRKEIVTLEEENASLEKLYIANVINYFSANNEDEDRVNDW